MNVVVRVEAVVPLKEKKEIFPALSKGPCGLDPEAFDTGIVDRSVRE